MNRKQCTNCGRFGHWGFHCWQLPQNADKRPEWWREDIHGKGNQEDEATRQMNNRRRQVPQNVNVVRGREAEQDEYEDLSEMRKRSQEVRRRQEVARVSRSKYDSDVTNDSEEGEEDDSSYESDDTLEYETGYGASVLENIVEGDSEDSYEKVEDVEEIRQEMAYGGLGELLAMEDGEDEVLVINLSHLSAPE